MKLLIRTGLMMLAVWVTFAVVTGLEWNQEWLTLFIIAVIIGLVNALIRPIARLLTLPIRIVTLGLFSLVLNVILMAGVIWVADAADLGVTSDGWQSTLLGGVILAIASAFVSAIGD